MKKGLLLTAALIGLTTASAKTELEFWTLSLSPWFDDEMKRVAAAFEKQNPDVTVKWVDVPFNAVEQKLLAAVAAGRPPAVVNLNADMIVKLREQGALEPMNELGEKNLGVYFDKALTTFKEGNRVYGLPWYWAPKVVMYNTDIMRKAGLDPNNPPRSVTGLIQAAKQIKDRTGNYGFMPNINGTNFLFLFQEAGLPILDDKGKKAVFNSPAHVRMLEQYVELYKKGYIPEDTMRRGYVGATELYGAGKLGMLITGPQFLLRVENDNKKIYELTKVGPNVVDLGGNVMHTALMAMSIPKGAKNKDLALKLAAFVTNDANQLQFSKVTKTTFPSTIKAARDPFFVKGGNSPIDQGRLVAAKQLPKAQDLTVIVPDASKLFKAFKDNIEAAMAGQKSSKQALDEIVKIWNASL